jgi:hypothetical protein
MLLLAVVCAAAALSVRMYPAPLAVLFCLVLGAASTLPLRVRAISNLHSLLYALVAGLTGAIVLCLGRLAASAAGTESGSPDVGAWTGTATGLLLLAGCSQLSLWTSAALARQSSVPWVVGRLQKSLFGGPAILRKEAGLERTEWELARASEYRRPLTLCLLGLDPGQDGKGEEQDQSGLEDGMRRIDQLLLRELTRFEAAAEHSPRERLLVLPEVWADGYAEAANELCGLLGGRVGRTVRAALVTFPFDGTKVEGLITDLELALDRCRADDALVAVGAVGRVAAGVRDFAS